MRRKNGMDRKHRAGLYLRLSKEDEAQGQSGSISNQRAILERYAQDQGWEVAGCYIDATVIIGLKQNPTHGRRFSPVFFA